MESGEVVSMAEQDVVGTLKSMMDGRGRELPARSQSAAARHKRLVPEISASEGDAKP
jgi:hypothetical protein